MPRIRRALRRLETRLLVLGQRRQCRTASTTSGARISATPTCCRTAPARTSPSAMRPASTHTQTWYYPSRKDCLECHNSHTPGQLGPKTRQMNRELHYPDGTTENQLRHWNQLGLFAPALNDAAHRIDAGAGAAGRHQPQHRGPGPLVPGCQLRALPSPRRHGGQLRCALRHAAGRAEDHRRPGADRPGRGPRARDLAA